MKKLSGILLAVCVLAVAGYAQTDTTFRLIKVIKGDIVDFTVDNLDNVYILNSRNRVYKYDANGDSVAVYNDVKKFGRATLIDVSRCIGCEACVDACKESNEVKFPRPVKPFPKMVPARVKVEDWSEKKDVRDRLTPYNWLFIQRAVVRTDGNEKEITLPRRCMHCVNPPCVKLCPWGAAIQQKNGISRMDPDLCLGGAKCKNVCPWKIPQRQTGAWCCSAWF